MRNYFNQTLFPTLRKQWQVLKDNPRESLLFFVILGIFLINTLYLSYPDEFVNLLGARSILEGKLPYVDFFDHHMPMAWYLGASLLKLSFGSFVLFRGWWALFLFSMLFGLALWIRKNYREVYPFYLGFFFLYPLVLTYFWAHLFVADSLSSLFFSISFWLIMVQIITKKYNYHAVAFSTFFTFCLLFSSMSFVYLCAALYLLQLYVLKFELHVTWKKIGTYIAYILTPYAIYGIFLLLTGSFADFFYANVTYNTNNYIAIENYDRGSFNPVKFALTLIYNFGYNYYSLLNRVKDLDLYMPIGNVAALGTFFMLILLATRRNIMLGGIFFFIMAFSAPRSTFEKVSEADYQIVLFLSLGTISAILSLYWIRKLKDTDIYIKDLARVVSILLSIYLLFSSVFLLRNSYNKAFQILISKKMISINNIAPTARFVDAAVREGQYYWIGPYEPNQVFFVKEGMLPGRHSFIMPQFREDESLKKRFLSQFQDHPPTVIVYKYRGNIFGTHSWVTADFLLDWMRDKYTLLHEIPGVTILQRPDSIDMEKDVYIYNTDREEVLQRLKETGFIDYKPAP